MRAVAQRTPNLSIAARLLCLLLLGAPVMAQDNAIQPELSIDQKRLIRGEYPLWQVLQSGQQLFNVPFTPAGPDARGDGMGEGHDGPRSFQRRSFNPYSWPNTGTELARWNEKLNYIYEYPFVKLNGLGATSCYDCHSSIGTWSTPGTKPQNGGLAMVRKPSTPGGSGGFSTNAFINSEYPARATALVRNPPHVMGTGYTNAVASEMSYALLAQAEATRLAARRQPGKQQSIALSAKGIAFGTFSSTWQKGAKATTDDFSAVQGVSVDLVIRPFQWKGIASSVRHFVRDALDFHFSMQAVEKVARIDCDLDGKAAEVEMGDVAALTAYVTMFRPPQQQIAPGKEAQVKRGAELFGGASGDQLCASCHATSLKLRQAVLTIDTPPVPDINNEGQCPQEAASLINPVASSAELPTVKQFLLLFPQVLADPNVRRVLRGKPTPAQLWDVMKPVLDAYEVADLARGNYQIDLSPAPSRELPTYIFPRLPANADGSVDVPLFSDLKQHNMGEALADPVPQGSDVAGISIPTPIFVTRPLWGVADTGPWLHDGRARDLREAILLHRSPGSDANEVIDAFVALGSTDQQAIIEFLLSLRLPVDVGVHAQAYGAAP